jgi:mannose-6-phosphate isomerase-like protein (cupin superfamily)
MFAVPPNTVALSATPESVHPALIARELAADQTRWSRLLRYQTDERYATLLEATSGQEIWLLSWLPGQGTDLHTHGPATGAFTVVVGELTERVARPERATQVIHQLVAGQSRAFAPGYVHQIRNLGSEPAVTIHVYRPARMLQAADCGLQLVS